jgi:uncharacterized DUF497 family protein
MIYEWDEEKRQTNIEKHGLDFVDAYLVCEDPLGVDVLYFVENEERCNTIGFLRTELVAVVTHTDRTDDKEMITRIISFRKANSSERRAYQDGDS